MKNAALAIDVLNQLGAEFNALMTRNGFNDDPVDDAKSILLMHTELSEAAESLRHGDPPSDKIPDFKGSEEELADCIYRILHYGARKKLDIAGALVAKHAYNATRPHKHGKKF